MIAKVKSQNRIYDTIIFAIINDSWNSKIIGFDENIERIQFIRYWEKDGLFLGTRRNVYVYDTKILDNSWVNDEKISGFSWIINDKKLMNKIKKEKTIDVEIMRKCHLLQSHIKTKEYQDICNEQDIENLLSVSLGFHDSYVESLNQSQDETVILMNTTWGCKIEFILKQVQFCNLEVEYGNLGEIFDANIFIEGDHIYWVDDRSVSSSIEIGNDFKYFSAKQVRWRLIVS